MLFNSYEFLFGFFPLTMCGFLLLWRFRPEWRGAFLALASVLFYIWWDARFVWLLIGSIVFNYLCGCAIVKSQTRKAALRIMQAGIAVDLCALGYFKYATFIANNFDALTGLDFAVGYIVLPIGISFYTFTQIAFLVDAYRGEAKEYNFTNYVLFVSYFPHLIAGPIIHHKSMMPQFESRAIFRPTARGAALGTVFFLIGLIKKVVLADGFALYADAIFNASLKGFAPDFAVSWVGALCYTFQIYFDFSGYCDMAIGLSLFFGVQLPFNFNSPYKARSIVDFWRRWHMTLSAFLREYLYIALGGNRRGPGRRYVNLLLTMLLGGLWHGANWTFVFWGALHGSYLIINHAWRSLSTRLAMPSWGAASVLASTALTFFSVIIAWVFFRAESFASGTAMLGGMFGLNGFAGWQPAAAELSRLLGYDEMLLAPVSLICLGGLIVWAMPNSQQLVAKAEELIESRRWSLMGASAVLTCFIMAIHSSQGVSPFIYFNF